jgi:hypothetical protein
MPVAGNATTEEGDPIEDTVWYRFKPTVTQRVTLRVAYAGNGFRHFVFEGDTLESLTRLKVRQTDDDTRFDVVAGRTYNIAVAAPFLTTDYEFARYVPFRLELDVADD